MLETLILFGEMKNRKNKKEKKYFPENSKLLI